MSNIKVGDILTTRSQFDAAPGGTIVVLRGADPVRRVRIKKTDGSNWYQINADKLAHGGLAPSNEYEVVFTPEHVLNEIDDLAIKLYNAGRDSTSQLESIDQSFAAKYYRAGAQYVLDNFTAKGAHPAKIVDGDTTHWVHIGGGLYTVHWSRGTGELEETDSDFIGKTRDHISTEWGIKSEIA